MTDVISAVNFIRSHGIKHQKLKVYLDKIKVNMVTLFITVKFIVLARVRFCNTCYQIFPC